MKNRYEAVDVMFFIPTGGGGAEKVSLNYASILKRHGFKVMIVFIAGATDNVCKFADKDIPSLRISTQHKLSRYWQIIRCVCKVRPKVVFSSLTALSACLLIAKKFVRGLKVVARQCFTPGTESKVISFVIRRMFNSANVNIAQTEEMRQAMIEHFNLKASKVLTINNPLDTLDIDNKTAGISLSDNISYKYVSIGRLHPQKDYPTLLKAFKKVSEVHPESTLKIIGSGDAKYKAYLQDEIRSLQLEDKVNIIAYTDNPYVELLQSDCFVLSSTTEGLPNVLLEAMYLNLPCVATQSIPFIRQQIQDGKNGYSCPVGDSEALAEAMMKAVNLKGKIHNTTFNADVEEQIIKLFSQCLQ